MVSGALRFTEAMQAVLQRIVDTQMENIKLAGALVADAIAKDGLVYTFGTGHSHVVAEEVSLRAGGLLAVDAILEPCLTGHTKMWQSLFMERLEGMAEIIADYYELSPQDVLVIISNSGRNAVPIEMAMTARDRGVPVIAITSLEMSEGTNSRHSSGKKLYQLADVVVDNCCPKGDCLLNLEGARAPVGGGSGVAGMFIIHTIMVEATQQLIDRGIDPPVGLAGNLDGAEEYNRPILERYKHRLKIW
jgi:uncharacterized phosphosugar-binding protein